MSYANREADTFQFPTKFCEEIFQTRYALYEGETWRHAAKRVADHVASAEKDIPRWSEEFYNVISTGEFCPGGRIWYGAGRRVNQLLNCFTLPVEDSREGWAKMLGDNLVISGTGGGVGTNFSPVRPRGTEIRGTGGYATGAVSLMRIDNGVDEEIKGGAGRRSAKMKALNLDHPDLEEFLDCKLDLKQLNNSNISVIFNSNPEEFFTKVRNNEPWDLVWNNEVLKTIPAKDIWDRIVSNFLKNGEPGILNGFLANKLSNIYYCRELVSTNPSMPKGTLVGTKEGIFPIEKLENKTFKVKTLDGTWATANCFLSGENEEVLEIDLGGGRKTHSTKQHRWPVLGRMGAIHKVYANELRPGDLIPLNLKEETGINGNPSLSREDGFFVGYLLGDGWVCTRPNGNKTLGFVFGQEEKYLAEIIRNYMNSRGTIVNITQAETGEYYIQSTCQSFIKFILDTTGYDESKKSIPTKIWNSNDECIKGFIDGIFSADGYVAKKESINPLLLLTSSKESMLCEIGKLLSFYGLNFYQYTQNVKGVFPNGKDYNKTYIRSDLRLSASKTPFFAKIFSFSHRDKQNKLEILASDTYRYHRNNDYAEVESVKLIGAAKVWDISVEHNQHVFPSQYCYTGNCGEIFMQPYSTCCLGAIVLPRFVRRGSKYGQVMEIDGEIRWGKDVRARIDWQRLHAAVQTAVRFLDDVLDVTHYPTPELKAESQATRRIGLGTMGVHDMLLQMGVKYSSEEGRYIVDRVMEFIKNAAYDQGVSLAIEKGVFPEYDEELFNRSEFVRGHIPFQLRNKLKQYGSRCCAYLTQAPTGTTSMAMGVSSGVEPIFSRAYLRTYKDLNHKNKSEAVVHPLFEEFVKTGFSVTNFEDASEIHPLDHLKMQEVFQNHTDNAVSKTINIPTGMYSNEEFSDLLMEWFPRLKGITVYPEGSREDSPLQRLSDDKAITMILAGKAVPEAMFECVSGVCER